MVVAIQVIGRCRRGQPMPEAECRQGEAAIYLSDPGTLGWQLARGPYSTAVLDLRKPLTSTVAA